MKALIALGVVAAGTTIWYQKIATQANRSDARCLVKILTGIRMEADPGRG